MKPVLVLWSCVVVLMTLAVARAGGEPDPRAALAKRVFRNAQGESLPYRLFVPRKYDPAKRFPILLFLHGAGERGSDNEAQLKHAEVLRFIREDVAAKEPCFLVAPQCPAEDTWAGLRLGGPYTAAAEPAKPLRLTMELLDSLDKEFSIDPDRRYVTGLSMGGFGSFDLCLRRPDQIAAAIPICGGGDESQAKTIARIAFWVFHGGADNVVAPKYSQGMVAALKQQGARVKYTEFPGVGHNSWTQAYQEPELVDWLFSQRRQQKP